MTEYRARYSATARRPLAPVVRGSNAIFRSISTTRQQQRGNGKNNSSTLRSQPSSRQNPPQPQQGKGNNTSHRIVQHNQGKHFHKRSPSVLQSVMHEGIPGVNPHLTTHRQHAAGGGGHRSESRARGRGAPTSIPHQYVALGPEATPNVSTVAPSEVAPSVQYAQAKTSTKKTRTGRTLGGIPDTRSVPLTSPEMPAEDAVRSRIRGRNAVGQRSEATAKRGPQVEASDSFQHSYRAATQVQQCKIEIRRLHSEQQRVRTEQKRQQAIQRNQEQTAQRQRLREEELRHRQEVEKQRWEKRLEVERQKLHDLASRPVSYRYEPPPPAAAPRGVSRGGEKRSGSSVRRNPTSGRHVDPTLRYDVSGYQSRRHSPPQPSSVPGSRQQRDLDMSTRQTMVDLIDKLKTVMSSSTAAGGHGVVMAPEDEQLVAEAQYYASHQQAPNGEVDAFDLWSNSFDNERMPARQEMPPAPMDNTATQLTHSIKERVSGHVGSRYVGADRSQNTSRHSAGNGVPRQAAPPMPSHHGRTQSEGSQDFHDLEDRYWNYSSRLIDKIQTSLLSETA